MKLLRRPLLLEEDAEKKEEEEGKKVALGSFVEYLQMGGEEREQEEGLQEEELKD